MTPRPNVAAGPAPAIALLVRHAPFAGTTIVHEAPGLAAALYPGNSGVGEKVGRSAQPSATSAGSLDCGSATR